jgi:hypothetical protein
VAFEIARRHRFVEEMASLTGDVEVHVLPSGDPDTPLVSMRYRDASRVADRIERGYEASARYLSDPAARPGSAGGPQACHRGGCVDAWWTRCGCRWRCC